jgi:hypothetical protein
MAPADAGRLLRVSVDANWPPDGMGGDLRGEGADFPGTVDRSIDEITEVIRQ